MPYFEREANAGIRDKRERIILNSIKNHQSASPLFQDIQMI
ncbi:hypothetical protein FHT28_004099 [Rhizobium sp. SG570]|nr:hypothetical protein [Rhizobium sp. SG570]